MMKSWWTRGIGSVALTSWSAVRLHPGERSRGNLEELVHKADLIGDARLAGEAVSAPNHRKRVVFPSVACGDVGLTMS